MKRACSVGTILPPRGGKLVVGGRGGEWGVKKKKKAYQPYLIKSYSLVVNLSHQVEFKLDLVFLGGGNNN